MTLLRLERTILRTVDGHGHAWAHVRDDNLLIGVDTLAAHNPLGTRVVAWSGWLGPEPARLDGLAQTPTPRDPRTWGPAGWSGLQAAVDRVIGAWMGAGTLLLRPHARHALSDAQRCLTLLRQREGQPIGLVLDPASMLEPSMLPHAEDHLTRMLGALGDHPMVAAVVVANVRTIDGDDGSALAAAPLDEGLVPRGLVERLTAKLVRAEIPRVVLAGDERAAVDGTGPGAT